MMLVEYPFVTPDYFSLKKSPVFCANCGGIGHVYKTCNHPITSYGIICFRLCYDKETNTISPKYLMVQRKDSLSFVEFLRGKYDVNNTKYLLKLFSNMTENERDKLRSMEFDDLWKELWCKSSTFERNKNFNKEYQDSKERFTLLKSGVFINGQDNVRFFFNIDYILDNSVSDYDETEWGFPKGRRNINEDDVNCALREFREETNISIKNIKMCNYMKPLEEVFSGTNNVRYKHVYYIAKLNSNFGDTNEYTPCVSSNNIEIKDIRWFDYNEAQSKIRNVNIERKELFKRLNQIVVKTIR